MTEQRVQYADISDFLVKFDKLSGRLSSFSPFPNDPLGVDLRRLLNSSLLTPESTLSLFLSYPETFKKFIHSVCFLLKRSSSPSDLLKSCFTCLRRVCVSQAICCLVREELDGFDWIACCFMKCANQADKIEYGALLHAVTVSSSHLYVTETCKTLLHHIISTLDRADSLTARNPADLDALHLALSMAILLNLARGDAAIFGIVQDSRGYRGAYQRLLSCLRESDDATLVSLAHATLCTLEHCAVLTAPGPVLSHNEEKKSGSSHPTDYNFLSGGRATATVQNLVAMTLQVLQTPPNRAAASGDSLQYSVWGRRWAPVYTVSVLRTMVNDPHLRSFVEAAAKAPVKPLNADRDQPGRKRVTFSSQLGDMLAMSVDFVIPPLRSQVFTTDPDALAREVRLLKTESTRSREPESQTRESIFPTAGASGPQDGVLTVDVGVWVPPPAAAVFSLLRDLLRTSPPLTSRPASVVSGASEAERPRGCEVLASAAIRAISSSCGADDHLPSKGVSRPGHSRTRRDRVDGNTSDPGSSGDEGNDDDDDDDDFDAPPRRARNPALVPLLAIASSAAPRVVAINSTTSAGVFVLRGSPVPGLPPHEALADAVGFGGVRACEETVAEAACRSGSMLAALADDERSCRRCCAIVDAVVQSPLRYNLASVVGGLRVGVVLSSSRRMRKYIASCILSNLPRWDIFFYSMLGYGFGNSSSSLQVSSKDLRGISERISARANAGTRLGDRGWGSTCASLTVLAGHMLLIVGQDGSNAAFNRFLAGLCEDSLFIGAVTNAINDTRDSRAGSGVSLSSAALMLMAFAIGHPTSSSLPPSSAVVGPTAAFPPDATLTADSGHLEAESSRYGLAAPAEPHSGYHHTSCPPNEGDPASMTKTWPERDHLTHACSKVDAEGVTARSVTFAGASPERKGLRDQQRVLDSGSGNGINRTSPGRTRDGRSESRSPRRTAYRGSPSPPPLTHSPPRDTHSPPRGSHLSLRGFEDTRDATPERESQWRLHERDPSFPGPHQIQTQTHNHHPIPSLSPHILPDDPLAPPACQSVTGDPHLLSLQQLLGDSHPDRDLPAAAAAVAGHGGLPGRDAEGGAERFLRNEIARLHALLEAKARQAARADQLLDDARERWSRLESDCAHVRCQANTFETRLRETVKQLKAVEEERSALRDRCAVFEKELSHVQGERDELARCLKESEREREKRQKEFSQRVKACESRLKEETEAWKTLVQNERTRLSEEHEKREGRMQSELNELRASVDQQSASLEETSSSVERLNVEVAEKDNTIAALTEKADSLLLELQDARESVERLEGQLADREHELGRARHDIHTMRNVISDYMNRQSAAERTVAELSEDCETWRSRCETQEKELERIREDMAQKTEDLQRSAQLTALIHRLSTGTDGLANTDDIERSLRRELGSKGKR